MISGCPKTFKQKSQQYSHMRNAHNYNTDLLRNGTGKAFMSVDGIVHYSTGNASPTTSAPPEKVPKSEKEKEKEKKPKEDVEINNLFKKIKKKSSKRDQFNFKDNDDIL